MLDLLRYLVIVAAGYVLGNFSTGVVVSRLQAGLDIREHGSGNAGATNMLRVLGSRPALLTLLGDIAKGLLAVGVGTLLGGVRGGLAGGCAAVIGHDWPVFFGFRGGKGVATSFAVVIILFPWQGLFALVVFAAILLKTRLVSLASILSALCYAVLLCATHWADFTVCSLSLLLFVLVAFQHRSNIARLRAGTESRLDFSKLAKK
ncbi:MAG: glycerol-3-phosphate 1-O-acyltransferase PlsY [Oscillospiraceae bacterium]|jgi:glycerol-3-phosphate acyltransferase PlsY|nr:glycerol-3-phosphate 1-O-acyltransferase PlsY [Oscillospiraceae bacterium]